MYGSGSGAEDARRSEEERQGRIAQGMKRINNKFSGFNNDFYKQREHDYIAALNPELNRQFDQTRKTLMYQLARSGLVNSSAAVERTSSLDSELAKRQSELANSAVGASNETRGNVENQRSQLVSQLNASGNPAAIEQGLVNSTANLRAPSPVQPIGNAFADWLDIYAVNRDARRQDPTTQPMTFSFGGDNSGSRIVR